MNRPAAVLARIVATLTTAAAWALSGCGTPPGAAACVSNDECVAPLMCVDGVCDEPAEIDTGALDVQPDGDKLEDTGSADTELDVPEDTEFDGTPRTCLRFEPTTLNFREVPVGRNALLTQQITNCSTLPIDITQTYITADPTNAFVVGSHPDEPTTLAPGASAEVGVVAAPTVVGEARAQLHIAYETGEHFGPLIVHGVEGDSCPSVTVGVGRMTSSGPATSISVPPGEPVLLFALPSGGTLDTVTWGASTDAENLTFAGEASGVTQWLPPSPGTWFVQAGWTAGSCTGVGFANVTVVPPEGLSVDLRWTPETSGVATDLDLHVARILPEGLLWSSADDCYYRQTAPDWGRPGPAGNPQFSGDDRGTPGLESVALSVPLDAGYVIGVHLYHDGGTPGAEATVHVKLGNAEQDFAGTLGETGEVWYPAAFIPDETGTLRLVEIDRHSAGFVSFVP